MSLTRESSTARFLANFGASLLRTKMTERSNSVRHKLWRALSETVSLHRQDLNDLDSRYCFDLMRETGGFDRDEARFRHAVSNILVCIGRSPKVVDIARSLARFLEEERDVYILEKVSEILERQNQRQQLLKLASEVLTQLEGTAVPTYTGAWTGDISAVGSNSGASQGAAHQVLATAGTVSPTWTSSGGSGFINLVALKP